MKKYDVVALGELLIDFTENGTRAIRAIRFWRPIQEEHRVMYLRCLTGLGHKTAFIGKVGEDFFGEQLKRLQLQKLESTHPDYATDKEIHTTLAMVHTYPDGDRDFSFLS